MSQALYWWPSSIPNKLPYVHRDGEPNPETFRSDKAKRAKVFQSSYELSLAWFYTEKTEYAKRAADTLRTWFVAAAARMNPNLNHSQLIPGVNTDRSLGIINFS